MINRTKQIMVVISCGLIQACALIPSSAVTTSGPPTVPALFQTRYQQALELHTQDKQQQAQEVFLQLHNDFPALSGPAVNIALIIMTTDPQQAEHYLQQAIIRNPKNYTALHLLGVLARQDFRLQQARDYYQQALALAPDYAQAWYNLAVLNEVYLGDFSAAVAAYTQYAQLNATDQVLIDKRIEKLKTQLAVKAD